MGNATQGHRGVEQEVGEHTLCVCPEMFPGRRDACASQVAATSQQARESPLQRRDCALGPQDTREHAEEVQVSVS